MSVVEISSTFDVFRMGDNCEVDTSAFRQAIWYYIHCMYGIRHDDYDYAQINQMLERNLKTYIKTVTCYPERITQKDYESVMRAFKHSEKVSQTLSAGTLRCYAEILQVERLIVEPFLADKLLLLGKLQIDERCLVRRSPVELLFF